MLTVKQASNLLGISNTTLRQRGAEYADYLSDYANPGKGETRHYTEDDIAVLRTVAVLKSQNKSEDDIRAALDAGEQLEPIDAPETPPARESKTTIADDKALTVNDAFVDALAAYENQVSSLQQKNDQLHERITELTERAVRAETKLEAVSILGDDESLAGGEIGEAAETGGEGDKPLTRRQRLARWIAGE